MTRGSLLRRQPRALKRSPFGTRPDGRAQRRSRAAGRVREKTVSPKRKTRCHRREDTGAAGVSSRSDDLLVGGVRRGKLRPQGERSWLRKRAPGSFLTRRNLPPNFRTAQQKRQALPRSPHQNGVAPGKRKTRWHRWGGRGQRVFPWGSGGCLSVRGETLQTRPRGDRRWVRRENARFSVFPPLRHEGGPAAIKHPRTPPARTWPAGGSPARRRRDLPRSESAAPGSRG